MRRKERNFRSERTESKKKGAGGGVKKKAPWQGLKPTQGEEIESKGGNEVLGFLLDKQMAKVKKYSNSLCKQTFTKARISFSFSVLRSTPYQLLQNSEYNV